MPAFSVVHNKNLFVSEPEASWLGNPPEPSPLPSTWTNQNWLKSRFHFNFAEYSFGRNRYGTLRVLNDDLVQPDRGFGTHPHSNMEIVTFVVDGELTHADSLGNTEALGRGSVQYMSAGSGIRHSEYNASKDTPLRFIQMWVLPRKPGAKPVYGSFESLKEHAEARKEKFFHLVSDRQQTDVNTPVEIDQDLNMHVAEISPGSKVTFDVVPGRQAYVLVIEGAASVIPSPITGSSEAGAPNRMERHDGAMASGGQQLTFVGEEGHEDGAALVYVIEMAASG
uniref:Pirin N-terminal domain-containing protein n=1 Tax=Chromera velia CCMP2878 TaxID=1169474 RepID=A0A0G4GDJ9_9ALVE|eukprot:Cvel_21405.t1-p1 / transcript=Cvel_21405.t1 / gene=Cvel_21405 / organism=Chromera_velia_CCMP2878 / gene_product=Putative quercetin 2,3-dioxygenase ZMO1337, putative / transcript_product=Putative quercetin 2,3-dioxygenase ZMO1337, putative / location=Cvel_scaffold2005:3904-4835(+) / protein_length=280 / sequence_SO=supercontig / SO=protein_coding / is_pseudo=false